MKLHTRVVKIVDKDDLTIKQAVILKETAWIATQDFTLLKLLRQNAKIVAKERTTMKREPRPKLIAKIA
jgi:hypothetical protein